MPNPRGDEERLTWRVAVHEQMIDVLLSENRRRHGAELERGTRGRHSKCKADTFIVRRRRHAARHPGLPLRSALLYPTRDRKRASRHS